MQASVPKQSVSAPTLVDGLKAIPKPALATVAAIVAVLAIFFFVRPFSGGSGLSIGLVPSTRIGEDQFRLMTSDQANAQAHEVVTRLFEAIRKDDRATIAACYAGDPNELLITPESLVATPAVATQAALKEFQSYEQQSNLAYEGKKQLANLLHQFTYSFEGSRLIGNQLTGADHMQVRVLIDSPYVARCEAYASGALNLALGLSIGDNFNKVLNSADGSWYQAFKGGYDLGKNYATYAREDMVNTYYLVLALALSDTSLIRMPEEGGFVYAYLDLVRDGDTWKVAPLSDVEKAYLFGGSNTKVGDAYVGKDIFESMEQYQPELEEAIWGDLPCDTVLQDPIRVPQSPGIMYEHDGSVPIVDTEGSDEIELRDLSSGYRGDRLLVTGRVRNRTNSDLSCCIGVITRSELNGDPYGGEYALPCWSATSGLVMDSDAGKDVLSGGDPDIRAALDGLEDILGNSYGALYNLGPNEERPFTICILTNSLFTIDDKGNEHAVDVTGVTLEIPGTCPTSDLAEHYLVDGSFDVTVDAVWYGKNDVTPTDPNSWYHVHGWITNNTSETVSSAYPVFAPVILDEAEDSDGSPIPVYTTMYPRVKIQNLAPGESAEFEVQQFDQDWANRGVVLMGVAVS